MRRRRSALAGDRRNPLTSWALRRNPGSLLPEGPTVGELPPGASELQVQFWAAQLQAAVAIFLEPCQHSGRPETSGAGAEAPGRSCREKLLGATGVALAVGTHSGRVAAGSQ